MPKRMRIGEKRFFQDKLLKSLCISPENIKKVIKIRLITSKLLIAFKTMFLWKKTHRKILREEIL
jgi:hypothetical protein